MEEENSTVFEPRPEQKQLSLVLRSIPTVLSAFGSSLVGAGVFLVISGATYYQSMFDRLGATWAFDIVPYAAMVRAGALSAVLFISATVMTVLVGLGGFYNRKEMPLFFWLSVAIAVVSAAVYSWVPGAHIGSTGKWLAYVTTLSGGYIVATAITMLLWLPPGSHIQRRWPIVVGVCIGLVLLVFWPGKVGKDEADRIVSGNSPSRHPDVCLKDDALHPWRLVSALDERYVVMRPDTTPMLFRVVASADISGLSAPAKSLPASGPVSSPCKAF